jgi:uncharacterized membrane protein YfcA
MEGKMSDEMMPANTEGINSKEVSAFILGMLIGLFIGAVIASYIKPI